MKDGTLFSTWILQVTSGSWLLLTHLVAVIHKVLGPIIVVFIIPRGKSICTPKIIESLNQPILTDKQTNMLHLRLSIRRADVMLVVQKLQKKKIPPQNVHYSYKMVTKLANNLEM